MKKIFAIVGLVFSCCTMNMLHSSTAYATDYDNGSIYAFDPDNPSAPATAILTGLATPDNIAVSPDGNTVYFTTDTASQVLSFPAKGPYVPTVVTSAITSPVGIAVSSDGLTLYIASDFPTMGIFTVPASGGPVTLLTPTGLPIISPLFLAISGNTAYVGDYSSSKIFSFPISPSQTTYNATLLQALPGLGGIAVSSDGYLYWSEAHTGTGNWVYRVPVASPTGTPTLVGTGPGFDTPDGLGVSCDGTTVFVGLIGGSAPGVYSIPTNQGLPQPATFLSSLNIPAAYEIAVGGCLVPPTNLRGSQKKCDVGLVYERCNILRWDPSPSIGVINYRIYRNGVLIATVGPDTFSYKDHKRKKGVTTLYSVTSVNQNGSESAPVNITVQ